jgi:hypothetical protein
MELVEPWALYDALRSRADVVYSRRDISFNGDLAIVVSAGLQLNPNLLLLTLHSSFINASGATVIAEALKVNSTLHQLDLCHNIIGDAGVAAIEESLERSFLGHEQS